MILTPPTSEEAPHIAALARMREAGFTFQNFSAGQDGESILYGERWCHYGVVENLTVRSMDSAVATRVRIEDYPNGDPLWQHIGLVAEVVDELLALPAHGAPGAPTLTGRASSSLWLPGRA